MNKVHYIVFLAIVGSAILFFSAPASAANTGTCTPCHSDGRTLTLDILEGNSTNILPTTLNVGQTTTVSVVVKNTRSPSTLATGPTTLSGVSLSLTSQNGHFSVSPPTYSVGTLAPGFAIASWTITGLSAGPDAILITGTGSLSHSETSFFDSYSPSPALTVNSVVPATYTLTVTTSGSGTVAKSPDAASYEAGSVVQLTATPAAGWSFTGWGGGLTGSVNPASVTVNANLTVTATFTQNQQPSSITCTTDKPTLNLGEGIAVSGVITPAVSGAVVKIEYRMGSTIINRTYTTGGDSIYHSTYTPTEAGSWTISASWPGNAQHMGATSQPLTVTVSQLPTTGGLRVIIHDKDSKPLAGANVSSTSAPSGQQALSGVTGSDGSISFNDVKVGAYTVEARMTGYTTNSASVQVNAGVTTEKTITLQAQTSPPSGIPGYSLEAIIIGATLAIALLLLLRIRHWS